MRRSTPDWDGQARIGAVVFIHRFGALMNAHLHFHVEGSDRQGRERLLRYCARAAFAQEPLRQIDPDHLVHESPKPGPVRAEADAVAGESAVSRAARCA